MSLIGRGNTALNTNPVTGVDEALSVHGSDWLWAVTAIYVLSFIVLLVLSFAAKESERVFHYLFTFALLVGGITYYAQASNLGWSAVDQIDNLGNGVVRQMFYAKYINWVVAFPSLVLGLGLISGVSWTTIVCNIAIAWYWVISYLVSAYTTTGYKWGFFAFGTFGWVILAMSTINESREAVALLGVERDYLVLAVWLNLLWVLYPIAFGLTDGGNVIGVTGSFIFFGVLDVLMVPVLSFAVLFFARNWDYRKLNIAFSDSRPSRESVDVCKEAPTASADVSMAS
ncbi:Rhodopsin, archaeal/bacterial/fungal [Penicillium expansum]|uniref:Rhodopsin, archaeal/bacterial/fungal n=1 Tax=Penicillium expansum TaxID=27334 RepID=A0A0A2J1Q7_PENEN|nr:Rhodopsin, archaeal/bacterial/fungal [Penicillium expansum]KGO48706.1 Rhodopsin, archaeal/bacterial/fungal [Penicillium expansum]KGO56035.1 Rhodopsin, archaeal/bacterial/fungal [Penicillium expansum]KGO57179.1 Rhodopsin, archaeal/bacterial/fungal [Penicillium expansum]